MIEIVENKLDVETYLDIRASVHWKVLRTEQAEKALNNSLYTRTERRSVWDESSGTGQSSAIYRISLCVRSIREPASEGK